MPNLIPDWLPWMRPAGRLIWGVGLLVVGLLIVGYLMHRPKPDRPATWAECMAGSVGFFALATLGYAVVPHEWLTFAGSYLQWGTTKFLFRSGQDMLFFPWHWPFNMDYRSVTDIITVGIYSVVFGLNLRLIVMWQQRGKETPVVAEKPRVSRFGRPLRRTEQPATAGGNS